MLTLLPGLHCQNRRVVALLQQHPQWTLLRWSTSKCSVWRCRMLGSLFFFCIYIGFSIRESSSIVLVVFVFLLCDLTCLFFELVFKLSTQFSCFSCAFHSCFRIYHTTFIVWSEIFGAIFLCISNWVSNSNSSFFVCFTILCNWRYVYICNDFRFKRFVL